MKNAAAQQHWRYQMAWGVVIIATGVVFLLDRTGQFEAGHLWHYWPLFLGFSGLANLVPPTTPKRVLSGLSSITVATWFYVSIEHVWGLGFHNSWPIFIIMWGVQVVLKPVLVQYLGDREECHAAR